MKTFWIAITMFFISNLALAQSHWGIKVGFNNTKLAEDTYNLENVPNFNELKLKLEDTAFKMHFGLLYHFEIGKRLFFQPEFLISNSKFTYKINSESRTDFIDKILDEKFTYLDIPIQIGFRIHPFQLGVGVVPQLLLNSVSDISSIEDIESVPVDQLSMAYTAGIGIDLLKTIKLELRYENSNELLGREIVIENERYNFASRSSQWLISASMIF